MRIRLLSVGGKMPAWVDAGYQDYARRLPPEIKLELKDLPLGPRGKNADLNRAMAKEGAAMLAALNPRDRVIALDVRGKPWSTEQLAEQLRDWLASGDDIALLVGGPDGLAPECLDRAQARWSLSPLTLPHPLVRVLLAEQLYRAWTVTQGHPYHRG